MALLLRGLIILAVLVSPSYSKQGKGRPPPKKAPTPEPAAPVYPGEVHPYFHQWPHQATESLPPPKHKSPSSSSSQSAPTSDSPPSDEPPKIQGGNAYPHRIRMEPLLEHDKTELARYHTDMDLINPGDIPQVDRIPPMCRFSAFLHRIPLLITPGGVVGEAPLPWAMQAETGATQLARHRRHLSWTQGEGDHHGFHGEDHNGGVAGTGEAGNGVAGGGVAAGGLARTREKTWRRNRRRLLGLVPPIKPRPPPVLKTAPQTFNGLSGVFTTQEAPIPPRVRKGTDKYKALMARKLVARMQTPAPWSVPDRNRFSSLPEQDEDVLRRVRTLLASPAYTCTASGPACRPEWVETLQASRSAALKAAEAGGKGEVTELPTSFLGRRRAMPSLGHGALGTCALVGLGRNLLEDKFGSEIDAHDTVIRFGFVPVSGYEEHVGRRTSITYVRPMPTTPPPVTFKGKAVLVKGAAKGAVNGGAPETTPPANIMADVWQFEETAATHPELFYLVPDARPPHMQPVYRGAPVLGVKDLTAAPQVAHDVYRLLSPYVTLAPGAAAANMGVEGGKRLVPSSGFQLAVQLLLSRLCKRLDLYGFSMNGEGHYFEYVANMTMQVASHGREHSAATTQALMDAGYWPEIDAKQPAQKVAPGKGVPLGKVLPGQPAPELPPPFIAVPVAANNKMATGYMSYEHVASLEAFALRVAMSNSLLCMFL
eukprot:jgi/Mesvir1/5123/Mv15279-RA.1